MSAKVVVLVRRRVGLTRDEFLRYWQVEHPAYVWALPGVQRYVQNPAIEHRSAWPYDGLAELWFPSVSAVAQAFKSTQADALREHEEHFIGEMEWFIASETDVPQPLTATNPTSSSPI